MSVLITGCSFQYRKSVAVFRNLNLEFQPGATVVLGPNGAGKSTLLSLIVGLLQPDSGTVRVGDLASHVRRTRPQYRRSVGWLPQNVTAMPGLKVREQVAYAGPLKGLSRRDAWDSAARALHRVAMLDLADRPSRALSGGQLRRVGIAQTLVHDARLVVMDEPSAGLDPRQRRSLRDVLNAVAGDVDVLVSTHQTEDISDVYQHVAVLNHGVVRYHGTVPSFLALAKPGTESSRQAEDAYIRLVGASE
ncbi:ATP-binding cassette domain-containing protein [Dactylosporangium sp. NPDC050688]|uniref:ABC transporter ATP-binding protein n=1 Tax=Dactylosporangium sp. NPDC050688 TaxID=3157217 RepID=UPI00340FE4F4